MLLNVLLRVAGHSLLVRSLKKTMVRVLEKMCPDKASCVNCVSLSISTITSCVEELGGAAHATDCQGE